jgi:hypothetical protein
LPDGIVFGFAQTRCFNVFGLVPAQFEQLGQRRGSWASIIQRMADEDQVVVTLPARIA